MPRNASDKPEPGLVSGVLNQVPVVGEPMVSLLQPVKGIVGSIPFAGGLLNGFL